VNLSGASGLSLTGGSGTLTINSAGSILLDGTIDAGNHLAILQAAGVIHDTSGNSLITADRLIMSAGAGIGAAGR